MKEYTIKDNIFTLYENEYSSQTIIEKLSSQLTPERMEKYRSIISKRSNQFIPIMEDIYDEGNINAVVRTSENFGFYEIGNIASIRLKKTPRISRGAEKWVNITQFNSIKDSISFYHKRNYKVYATHLDSKAIDYREIDYTQKTAIIFGNEKDGCTEDAIRYADGTCIIPTSGLTQSFNISVACSIIESYAYNKFEELGFDNKLTLEQKDILLAQYILHTLNHDGTIKHYLN